MKEVLHYPDTFEIHAPNFDCGTDGGSSDPAATDQEVPTGLKPAFSADHESTEY